MHWHQQVPYYQLMQRKLDPDKPCSFFCLCYHSHQSPSHFLIYTSPKCFVFHVWYVCVFLVYCSDSSYLLWRMTMYFLNCISTVWNQGYRSAFCGLLCYDRCWTKYRPFLYYPRVSGYRHHKKSYLFNPFMLPWTTNLNRCQQSEVCILSNSNLLNIIVYIYRHNWEDNGGTNIQPCA